MAELSTDPTPTSSCCSTAPQAACCEPCEKDGCCGPDAPAGGCGCSAGQTTAPQDIRETVRETYAAAARAVAEQQASQSCCAPIAVADADQTRVFGAALYDTAESEGASATAVAASLGCGVPTAVAPAQSAGGRQPGRVADASAADCLG